MSGPELTKKRFDKFIDLALRQVGELTEGLPVVHATAPEWL